MTGIFYLLIVPLLYALGWLLFALVLSSIIGVAINRVITHWYQTRLNYQVSLARQARGLDAAKEMEHV